MTKQIIIYSTKSPISLIWNKISRKKKGLCKFILDCVNHVSIYIELQIFSYYTYCTLQLLFTGLSAICKNIWLTL